MNSLTATALEWHNQGQDDKRVLDNTVSDLVDRVIDDYDLNIEPNEYEQVVLDLAPVVDASIDWDELYEADVEPRN